jgi:hypothetical protein
MAEILRIILSKSLTEMRTLIIFFIIFMGIFSRLFGATDQGKAVPSQEAQGISREAIDRKARSTAYLKTRGVPTLESLPYIEDSSSAKIRSPRAVAERFVACTIAAVGGETGDPALIATIIKEFDAERLLTPNERVFLTGQLGNKQQRVQFSWQYERAWVLLWALGYIERLDYPLTICDVPRLARFLQGKSVEQILREAKPRSQKELLDEADLIYRLHWAVVEERVNKSFKIPDEIEKGVVQERHYVLNWLIGYMDLEWDDVTTDT